MRTLNRNNLKEMYKKFCDSWRVEKRYQQDLRKQDPDAKMTLLGKRPTFKMWLAWVKTLEARKTATPEQVQEFKDENIDLSWEEEEVKK